MLFSGPSGILGRTILERKMINPRAVNVYGFIAIGAMTLMLVLVVAKVVPPRMYSALFYTAAALFAIRIILRIVLARQKKKEAELSGEEKGGTAGT